MTCIVCEGPLGKVTRRGMCQKCYDRQRRAEIAADPIRDLRRRAQLGLRGKPKLWQHVPAKREKLVALVRELEAAIIEMDEAFAVEIAARSGASEPVPDQVLRQWGPYILAPDSHWSPPETK